MLSGSILQIGLENAGKALDFEERMEPNKWWNLGAVLSNIAALKFSFSKIEEDKALKISIIKEALESSERGADLMRRHLSAGGELGEGRGSLIS